MRRALSVVAVTLAVGCGPSFDGDYAGTMGLTEACDDGTSQAVSMEMTWVVRADGRRLTITAGQGCDPISASADDATDATINAKTCPAFTTPAGLLARPGIVGGSLFLAEPVLSVSMRMSFLFTDAAGGTASCQRNYLGSLARVR